MKRDGYEDLRILIRGTMAARGTTQTDLADWLGYSPNTITKKMKHPEELTIAEAKKIARKLGIPAEKMMEALR